MTPLQAIFAELDARLATNAIVGLASYERMPPGDPARYPALALYDEGDDPAEQEAGSTRLELEISVEGYVVGVGSGMHDALIALHADAVAALCGDAGTNLGGLVENIEIVGRRRVAVAHLADQRRLGFAQSFKITYATARGDPHQPA